MKVQVGQIEVDALVDTGAPWCILGDRLAEKAGWLEHAPTLSTILHTRLGRLRGYLRREYLTLVAESGESLSVEATFFVSPDWLGPTFIGYSGCLERMRFAVDPAQSLFYFGAAAA
ncbi:MAG TPA: hypothetical protein VGO93_07545 [Candidatus Xenobia bacterium]